MISKSFRVSAFCLCLLAAAIEPGAAQTNFTIFRSLGGSPDGAVSYGALVADSHWTLYGATIAGGISNQGTVFSIKLDGTGYKSLHAFIGATDGAGPYGGLTLASDGRLYGTTLIGSASNAGTVFALNTDGTGFTVLHSFTNGPDGGNPEGGVIEGGDGALYGTASSIAATGNHGTVFKINKDSNGYTIIHPFVVTDGQEPEGRLIQGTDDSLYGTTASGGSQGGGTIFKLNTDGGGFTNLHSFLFTTGDGIAPEAGVLEASDHVLYGTTYNGGGTGSNGVIYKINMDSTGYQVIYAFSTAGPGLERPDGELMEGTNGTLYGGADSGATVSAVGGIFKLNKDGSEYTVLRTFGTNGDGAVPKCALLQATNGALYGTTKSGGAATNGCIFALSISPLPPLILSVSPSAGSNVLQFTGAAATQYDVERSTNLSSWSILATLTTPPGCQTNYSDLASPRPAAYYQIHQH